MYMPILPAAPLLLKQEDTGYGGSAMFQFETESQDRRGCVMQAVSKSVDEAGQRQRIMMAAAGN
jgi:hypothetical protein